MPGRGRKPRKFDNLSVERELDINRKAAFKWDGDRGILVVNGPGQPGAGTPIEVRGLNMAKDRITLAERFLVPPKLNAVQDWAAADTYTTAAAVALHIANRDFELLGTNASSAASLLYAEGGVEITTATSANDQMIIAPHLNSNQTAWTVTTWGTDQQTRWECAISTAASIASVRIWAGLKLTNTSVIATDNEQAFFVFDTGASANATKWHTVYSVAGADTEAAVGDAVAASTKYHLCIDIDSSRVARFYLDGNLVTKSSALANATDLIPYIGVQTLTTAAKAIRVFHQGISRKAGA